MSPRAVLVGFMGAGKSTVAALLAARWAVAWADSDVEVEARAGRSVAAVFAAEGERAFRDLEEKVVLELLAGDVAVVSLGGGACARPAVQAALRGAPVVYLRTSLPQVLARVGGDPDRPVLARARGDGGLAALHAARAGLYERLARVTVDTDERSPQDVAESVRTALLSL